MRYMKIFSIEKWAPYRAWWQWKKDNEESFYSAIADIKSKSTNAPRLNWCTYSLAYCCFQNSRSSLTVPDSNYKTQIATNTNNDNFDQEDMMSDSAADAVAAQSPSEETKNSALLAAIAHLDR